MKTQKSRSTWIWADVISLFMISAFMLIAAFCGDQPEEHYSDTVTSMMSDWRSSDGAVYSLYELPEGDVVLTHSLDGIDILNKRLCMKSDDTFLEAAADGKVIYTYSPEQSKLMGRSYGKYLHMIPIPSGTKELTLSVHPIFEKEQAYLRDVAVEDAGMYMGDLFKKALPDYSACLLMVIFGLLMLFIGISSKDLKNSGDLNFFSLGTFAILVGIWSVNDTYILQTLTQFPALIKLLNYLCLIFIAYPPVSFAASATNHKDTVLLKILLVLIMVNFVSTILLNSLGICDLHYMLNVSQAIIAVAMFMTVYLIVRAVRHKSIGRQFARTLIIGMGTALIGVMADLIRYKTNSSSIFGTSAFTRIGVLVFLIVVGVHLIHERNRLVIDHNRAEVMAKMAYTDGLTTLHNRIAFNEKENEVRSHRKTCVIVQLDINNLKTVNDVYGHAEGDKHIISAANIIQDSFAAVGTCYRTGGDEFIVVVEHGDIPETENALAEMQQMISAYNDREQPPVSLQIAYGYAKYSPPEDMLEAAEHLADQRMYERKRAMKSVK